MNGEGRGGERKNSLQENVRLVRLDLVQPIGRQPPLSLLRIQPAGSAGAETLEDLVLREGVPVELSQLLDGVGALLGLDWGAGTVDGICDVDGESPCLSACVIASDKKKETYLNSPIILGPALGRCGPEPSETEF